MVLLFYIYSLSLMAIKGIKNVYQSNVNNFFAEMAWTRREIGRLHGKQLHREGLPRALPEGQLPQRYPRRALHWTRHQGIVKKASRNSCKEDSSEVLFLKWWIYEVLLDSFELCQVNQIWNQKKARSFLDSKELPLNGRFFQSIIFKSLDSFTRKVWKYHHTEQKNKN